jgi:hypothetical protein
LYNNGVQPVITKEQAEKLKILYLNEKRSLDFIIKNSLELFGQDFDFYDLKEALKNFNISQRSMSESISIGTRTLNYELSYLDENMVEWFDGFLLGDGSLRFNNSFFKEEKKLDYARISMASTQEEWAKHAVAKFTPYFENGKITIKKYAYENSPKNPNPLYVVRSLGHPDIVKQAMRWYPLPETKKIIPNDIRITPTSVMLWYLGDGSLVNNKSIKFATCGFSNEQILDLLIPKLESLGIYSYLGHWKQYAYIWVRRNSVGKFFDFIGKASPIRCYDYKFDYDKMYSYKRLCDIVKNKRELWRAQWFCKHHKVEYTRTGKFFLFTNEQANLLRSRLDQHNKTNFSEESAARILEKYKLGLALTKISKEENVAIKAVRRLLLENGIKIKNAGSFRRRYIINHNFFSKIDTPEKAYVFGFLLADGYNNVQRGVIETCCAIKDKDILEKINSSADSTYKIKEYLVKGKRYCRLFWSSEQMSQDLVKLGCGQKKTFLIDFVDFGEKYQHHFIRGFFDGDGCISYTFAKRDNCYGNSFLSVITFTSTEKFCCGLKNYLLEKLGINATMLCRFPERNNNIRTLQISGNIQVALLRDWIYNGATIFLDRKYKKFEEIKEILKKRNSLTD